MVFLLNSQAQGVSGKNEQSTQTPWRVAQCSCIGWIGLRPALPPTFSKLHKEFLIPRPPRTKFSSVQIVSASRPTTEYVVRNAGAGSDGRSSH